MWDFALQFPLRQNPLARAIRIPPRFDAKKNLGFAFVRDRSYVNRIGRNMPCFETKKSWQKLCFSRFFGMFCGKTDPFSAWNKSPMLKWIFVLDFWHHKIKHIGSIILKYLKMYAIRDSLKYEFLLDFSRVPLFALIFFRTDI